MFGAMNGISSDDGLRSNSGTPQLLREESTTPATDASDSQGSSNATPKEEENSFSTKERHRDRSVESSKRRRRTSRNESRSRNELAALPHSSPAQIYRNLLTLEESFRQQYSEHALSRRKHVLFFSALVAASSYFSYAIFISPSIYRLFSFIQRVGFVASVICLGLFYLTGLYHKTFIMAPRFVNTANKGLREFNLKLVRISPSWKESVVTWMWNPAFSSRPGGLIKLVVSSRAFSPETVDGWEIYRQEYWGREYERQQRRKTQPKDKSASSTQPVRRKATISKPVAIK